MKIKEEMNTKERWNLEFFRFKMVIRCKVWWKLEKILTTRLLKGWTNRFKRTRKSLHPRGVRIMVKVRRSSQRFAQRPTNILDKVRKQIQVRTKWYWRKVRRAELVRGIIPVALFIALAWWSENARDTVAEVRRIPLESVWWIFGGIVGLLLLIWLLRLVRTAFISVRYKPGSYRWVVSLLKWAAGFALIAMILFNLSKPDTTVVTAPVISSTGHACPSSFNYIVRKELGETVERPAGCDYTIQRRAPVGYVMVATTVEYGDTTILLPAGQKTRKYAPTILAFRLKLMEGEKVDSMIAMISLQPK